ncbi:MAG TPA: hypothetical protein VIG24_07810 [Acidimicrobiia bacterium]
MKREKTEASQPMTAEQLITELNRYGRLSMFQYESDATWCARLEMQATNPAITAKVTAGGHREPHQTLTAALRALLAKVKGDGRAS